MTTFQGPPPQSRRAARESERAAQLTSPGVDYLAFAAPEQPEQTEADLAARETARPAPGGRRAQRPEGHPAAEPLTYETQIPSYSGPSFSRVTPTPEPFDAPNEPIEPAAAEPAPFRVRDFSPEGRRSAGQQSPPQPNAADLDYRTQAADAATGWQPPVVDAPPLLAPPTAAPAPQPMTRRELRAMQAKADAAAEAEALVEPVPAASSATALSNAIAEFEALTRANQQSAPVAEPVAAPETLAEPTPFVAPDPFAGMGPAPSAAQRVELPPPTGEWETVPPVSVEAVSVEPVFEEPQFAEPVAASPVIEHEPESIPDTAEPAAFPFALQSSSHEYVVPTAEEPATHETEEWSHEEPEAATSAEPAQFVEPQVVRESYTPPVGHWTRQADLDDDAQPYETTLSRAVGASNVTTTTSALILPSIPQGDFSSIINGTGEILITGTIELPHGLGTTGGDSRHYDNPDVDHMFDAFDKELVSNDSQPVRAIRAVSTHTATRGIIQVPTKRRSNRLLTAGMIALGVLIVAVVGLLAVYIVKSL